ncbi:hypothetical protein [Sphingobium sp. BHU LFT2]|uniref:hypothetical protein n=1 Tax=Sphingobium sp. BHU LFT2 TaxID=2807634 RepID=UPI0020364A9E|nr:hypothetical protein [Sphingobium sp. BHU LFT2]
MIDRVEHRDPAIGFLDELVCIGFRYLRTIKPGANAALQREDFTRHPFCDLVAPRERCQMIRSHNRASMSTRADFPLN